MGYILVGEICEWKRFEVGMEVIGVEGWGVDGWNRYRGMKCGRQVYE